MAILRDTHTRSRICVLWVSCFWGARPVARRDVCMCTTRRTGSPSNFATINSLRNFDDTGMATTLQTQSAASGLRQPRHVSTSGSVCVLISSLAAPPGCCHSPTFQTWCSLRRARQSVLPPSLPSVNHPTSRAASTVSESVPTARSHAFAKARPPPQPEH